MELFDKKFVRFVWDDELQGKKCFVSDGIDRLKEYVENDESNMRLEVTKGHGNRPFAVDWTDDSLSDEYQFAYYDPNYEAKRAFNEGKKVQYQLVSSVDWGDIDSEEALKCRIAEGRTFRVKPEEKAVVDKRCSSCVHEHCSATKEPCVSCKPGNSKYEARLCKTCEHFDTEVDEEPCDSCIDECDAPNWEPKKKKEKTWRPYESSAEMIMDFINRFNVKCPSYCEPLIWIAHKTDRTTRLIVEFSDRSVKIGCKVKPVDFGKLFEYWTYRDGSPCGMEC